MEVFRMPTRADTQAFAEKGVLHLPGTFSEEAVAGLSVGIDEEIRAETLAGRVVPAAGFFLQKSFVWRQNRALRTFLFDAGVGEVCAALLGARRVQLYEDSVLVKAPGADRDTPWHQDLPYYPLASRQVCTIWIPVDRVTRENGACRYLIGSHRSGRQYAPVAFSTGKRLDCGEYPLIEEELSRYDLGAMVHFDTQPSDCIVHHGLTVHGAYGNRSRTSWRRAYAISVFGDRTRLQHRSFRTGPADFDFHDGDIPQPHRFPYIAVGASESALRGIG